MHRRDRRRRKRFQHEVAVGDGIERIRHRTIEAECFRGHVAVDREGRAGKRRGAEWAFIEPRPRIPETAAVARGHLHIGEEVMAEGHRLRRLQVGKARHHGRGVRQRLLRECLLIAHERIVERADGGPDPETEIGRHLVVARARGMQPPGRRPDQLGKPAFHVHMDVLQRAAEGEGAGLDF